jgi:hypothetical protein
MTTSANHPTDLTDPDTLPARAKRDDYAISPELLRELILHYGEEWRIPFPYNSQPNPASK